MINHEMEWGDDEFDVEDPICTRCNRLFSLHNEVVGITAEDDMVESFTRTWTDNYRRIADSDGF